MHASSRGRPAAGDMGTISAAATCPPVVGGAGPVGSSLGIAPAAQPGAVAAAPHFIPAAAAAAPPPGVATTLPPRQTPAVWLPQEQVVGQEQQYAGGGVHPQLPYPASVPQQQPYVQLWAAAPVNPPPPVVGHAGGYQGVVYGAAGGVAAHAFGFVPGRREPQACSPRRKGGGGVEPAQLTVQMLTELDGVSAPAQAGTAAAGGVPPIVRLVYATLATHADLASLMHGATPTDIVVFAAPAGIDPATFTCVVGDAGWAASVYTEQLLGHSAGGAVTAAICVTKQSGITTRGHGASQGLCHAELVCGAAATRVNVTAVLAWGDARDVAQWAARVDAKGTRDNALTVVVGVTPREPLRTTLVRAVKEAGLREVRPTFAAGAAGPAAGCAFLSRDAACGIDVCASSDARAAPVMRMSLARFSCGSPGRVAAQTAENLSTTDAGESTRSSGRGMYSCKIVRLERALRARFTTRHEHRSNGNTNMVKVMNREINDIRRKLEVLKAEFASKNARGGGAHSYDRRFASSSKNTRPPP